MAVLALRPRGIVRKLAIQEEYAKPREGNERVFGMEKKGCTSYKAAGYRASVLKFWICRVLPGYCLHTGHADATYNSTLHCETWDPNRSRMDS